MRSYLHILKIVINSTNCDHLHPIIIHVPMYPTAIAASAGFFWLIIIVPNSSIIPSKFLLTHNYFFNEIAVLFVILDIEVSMYNLVMTTLICRSVKLLDRTLTGSAATSP